jgi:ABC-type protease/lipase transport system fused ATPase/permease subunit
VIIAHRSTLLCAVDHMLVLNEGRLQAYGKTESVLPLLTPAKPPATGAETPRRAGRKQSAPAHV